jgi:hypothetical protein
MASFSRFGNSAGSSAGSRQRLAGLAGITGPPCVLKEDQSSDPTSEEMINDTRTNNTSSNGDSNTSMLGKFTGSVKNLVRNYKLKSAWAHLPTHLQEKFRDLENMKSMLPFKGVLRNNKTNSIDPVKLSVKGDSSNITFVIDCLDKNDDVIKENNIHLSFTNKKWTCTAIFDEHGRDFISMAESPLFGNMSETDVMDCTRSAIGTICDILDSLTSQDGHDDQDDQDEGDQD